MVDLRTAWRRPLWIVLALLLLLFAFGLVAGGVRVGVEPGSAAPAGFRAVSATLEDAYMNTIRGSLAGAGAAA